MLLLNQAFMMLWEAILENATLVIALVLILLVAWVYWVAVGRSKRLLSSGRYFSSRDCDYWVFCITDIFQSQLIRHELLGRLGVSSRDGARIVGICLLGIAAIDDRIGGFD